MRSVMRNVVVGAVLCVMAAPPARAVDQKDIDRAIEQGVAALKEMQGADGTWQYEQIGATALAGVTLLECNVAPTDKSIVKAAAAVRQSSVQLTQTYSIALCILFLDRLGDPGDVALIESLAVRLMAGQDSTGGWGYNCPPIADTEVRRLTTVIGRRGDGVEPRDPPPKRTAKDLAPEITQQLAMLNRIQFDPAGLLGGDNSNTQFAALGLWVARRHGMPVDDALDRLAFRFRRTQAADGGWCYTLIPNNTPPPPGYEHMVQKGLGARAQSTPTAAMTCAGLMCLAVSHGASLDPDRDPRRRGIDPEKDVPLQRGLLALSSAIGNPFGKDAKLGDGIPIIDEKNGEAYYFFWSLERVAVALGLETIGKKDWYTWGAEILLANQHRSGHWIGNYASCGADTCFALLFLRRSNLSRDLSARLQRRVRDEVVLRVGGVGGTALKGGPKVKSALDPKDADARATGPGKIDRDKVSPIPTSSENRAADKLSDELVRAAGSERGPVLQKLRDEKGVEYTEALALAIPRLEGDTRSEARDALAKRLTRMTAPVLARYHTDTDPEIRRAAVLASSMKDLRDHLPALVDRLSDGDPGVSRAALAALKAMTMQDFGPTPDASREEHEKAVQAWKDWVKRQGSR